jgi:AcrR family transcriptional regulator
MADDSREKMVLGAMRLLATSGLEGLSFSTVLEVTGAPRGSIYHHFPEGKDQLIKLALERAGQILLTSMETSSQAGALDVAEHFFDTWRHVLVDSNFKAGCAVAAVTVATRDPVLLKHARIVFRSWQDCLTQQLTQGGLTRDRANTIGIAMITSAEGAVILCRAMHSVEPLEAATAPLLSAIKGLVSPRRTRRKQT